MNKVISEKLKFLRKKNNLTQTQLCNKLNENGYLIKRCAYANYEIGKRTVPYEVLVALVNFYGTSADYILGIK